MYSTSCIVLNSFVYYVKAAESAAGGKMKCSDVIIIAMVGVPCVFCYQLKFTVTCDCYLGTVIFWCLVSDY